MSKTCCVDGCQITNEDVTYFPLPVKPGLRRKWREAMSTSNVNNYSLICSAHFTENDYEHVRGKLRLKAKVVPSVFHNKTPPPKPPESSTEERTETDLQLKDDETKSDTKQKSRKRRKKNKRNDSEDSDSDSDNSNGAVTKRKKRKERKDSDVEDCSDSKRKKSDERNGSDVDEDINNSKRKRKKKNNVAGQGSDNLLQGSDNVVQESGHGDDFYFEVPLFSEDLVNDGVVGDDGQENCTIECVPEAILAQDSCTESEPELHKEDIEDIIANYHIKQDKKLAVRLKSQEKEQENQKNGKCDEKKQEIDKQEREKRRESEKRQEVIDDLDDCIEVEFRPSENANVSHFVEISVGQDKSVDANSRDDCLMLLEDVQVNIDPATLLLDPDDDDSVDGDAKKADPISLLTSSDEDDVILEEPKIDTVEVSDEDEDDQPLVKLVTSNDRLKQAETITKILWGNLYEYYCMHCHFKTTSRMTYQSHKELHSTVIQMCEICKFTSASKAQFARHKKKHKDEKRFKCHLCEYKARHNMSLIYHMKSHDNVSAEKLEINKKITGYRCPKCKYTFGNKNDMLTHGKSCKSSVRMYSCPLCDYETKRRSDLRRHKSRRHVELEEGDDDYVPPPWADD